MLTTRLRTAAVSVTAMGILAVGLTFLAYHGFTRQSASEDNKESTTSAEQEVASKNADRPDEKKSQAHYCWLVFGPKAQARTLVRLDGDEVAVDRDNDGKHDGKGERFRSEKECKDVVIADSDGTTSYVITHVHVLHVVPPERFIEIRVRIRGAVEFHQCGIIQTAEDRQVAPQAHFNGPLTIAPKGWTITDRASRFVESEVLDVKSLLPQSLRRLAGKELVIGTELPKSLKRVDEPTSLSAVILTEGKNSIVAVCPSDAREGEASPFSEGIHPSVDVEFPGKRQGDSSVKKQYPLRHLREGLFLGTVRVPDEAGVGKARTTFSFDTWKRIKVAPTTVEIPIDEPQGEGR
jgi:hypothetical protein